MFHKMHYFLSIVRKSLWKFLVYLKNQRKIPR
ncbi:replication timing regulatory factor 1 [Phyllostomus discolor]|uniref:Replication timing regulatory factor 1 n=1 Tax=Phyllostomus discolor TaxID=89673 RepID=A0A834ARZ3_9CHIR|nr:replication timing regulatory factor 1 [Phyllostomus discolor]